MFGFFQTHRLLLAPMAGVSDEAFRAFCREQSDALCDAVYQAFIGWTSFDTKTDYNALLSRYSLDYEQWWNVPRPHVDEY